jgi:hypothetical protein
MPITKLLSACAAIILAAGLGTAKAQAAQTQVNCHSPIIIVSSGRDGGAPRVTIACTGASSAGNITFFAWRISDSPDIAHLIQASIAAANITKASVNGVIIWSDLSDTSGDTWGCGSRNCRIINQVDGD